MRTVVVLSSAMRLSAVPANTHMHYDDDDDVRIFNVHLKAD